MNGTSGFSLLVSGCLVGWTSAGAKQIGWSNQSKARLLAEAGEIRQTEKAHLVHTALQTAIVFRAIASDQGRIQIAGMARKFYNLAGYADQPAAQILGVGDADRIGHACQRAVAWETRLVEQAHGAAANRRKKQTLQACPRHANQNLPRLTHPTNIRQGSLGAEQLDENLGHRGEDV